MPNCIFCEREISTAREKEKGENVDTCGQEDCAYEEFMSTISFLDKKLETKGDEE